MKPLPSPENLTIGFAHVAYALADEYARRGAPYRHFEVRDAGGLAARVPEADVLVVSGLWRDALLAGASRLCFIQSISAGTDQFAREPLRAAGVRLASAQGANEEAVAEHAMALILALARQLHRARDHQAASRWRPMIADRGRREQEIRGQTLVIVGLGRIGSRRAAHAKAFGMHVVGVKRSPATDAPVDRVVAPEDLLGVLPQADVVALTCPLTPETEGLIGAAALAAMKPGAHLVNVARGRVVDEAALIRALSTGAIAGAGLDCFVEEPLAAASPLWSLDNVLVTPHAAGETRLYETNVVDLLLENIARLYAGETPVNAIIS
ncbi:MAG: D-2-hydroxyacid dehydrogenase [Microvirga sp.]